MYFAVVVVWVAIAAVVTGFRLHRAAAGHLSNEALDGRIEDILFDLFIYGVVCALLWPVTGLIAVGMGLSKLTRWRKS